MPHILTGNHASQSDFILSDNAIKQRKGLYCLNDLHKASGGNPKHKPLNFLRKESTQGLIQAIENIHFSNMRSDNQKMRSEKVIITINGGNEQGTYVCKELVYAYAMWIEPRFYLMVLQVFDRVVNPQMTYTNQLNVLLQDLSDVTKSLSFAGRFLCVGGKQVKPAIQKQIDVVLDKQQLKLGL